MKSQDHKEWINFSQDDLETARLFDKTKSYITMALKPLPQNERRALKEFKVQLLKKLKGEVLELKLFGSKARGDFKPWPDSDIDVLVILKRKSRKKDDYIMGLTCDLLHKHNALIEAKVFSRAGFKKGLDWQIPFYLEVQKEGVDI